jgi:hypothetical protein
MVEAFIVDQNELFFSMVNYVLSEQKTPDWVFKTSYIFIKEDNVPLEQSQLFLPDQIGNIIDYIKDVKPYHTQIRDYSSSHHTTDLVIGSVILETVDYILSSEGAPGNRGTLIPRPQLNSLVPNNAIIGGLDFSLVANGENFISGAVMRWNGVARPTSFISTTQMSANISAADIAALGTAQISIVNPGGSTSNTLPFSIVSPTLL